MTNQPDHTNSTNPPRPITPGAWRHHRSFVVGYTAIILLPLAFLIAWLCYARGMAREFGPVTITHTWSFLDKNISGGTGLRGGGTNPTTSLHWDYRVWGETGTGRQCFIEVRTQQAFNAFTEGEVVSAWYTTHKNKGEWRWTSSADFVLKAWVWAFLVMLALMWVKELGRLKAGAGAPPPLRRAGATATRQARI